MSAYLTTRQLAERIGLSPITLEIWRSRGSGPPYLRLGRAIRYDLAEVERWLAARAVEPEAPAETPAERQAKLDAIATEANVMLDRAFAAAGISVGRGRPRRARKAGAR